LDFHNNKFSFCINKIKHSQWKIDKINEILFLNGIIWSKKFFVTFLKTVIFKLKNSQNKFCQKLNKKTLKCVLGEKSANFLFEIFCRFFVWHLSTYLGTHSRSKKANGGNKIFNISTSNILPPLNILSRQLWVGQEILSTRAFINH
jgi:hypothetical protein